MDDKKRAVHDDVGVDDELPSRHPAKKQATRSHHVAHQAIDFSNFVLYLYHAYFYTESPVCALGESRSFSKASVVS